MVGVLEENRSIRVAVDRAVIALLDQHMGLALFLHLAFDELHDVRVIDIQDHHLRRSPRFSAALDHARKCIKSLHEAHRARSNSAAAQRLSASAQRREVRSRARAPLEQHSLGPRQPHDRFHVVADRIDEARRALRLGLHAHVEPHRRIEGHFLLDQQMRQLIAESISRRHVGKVPAFFAPPHDGIHHPPDQLPH